MAAEVRQNDWKPLFSGNANTTEGRMFDIVGNIPGTTIHRHDILGGFENPYITPYGLCVPVSLMTAIILIYRHGPPSDGSHAMVDSLVKKQTASPAYCGSSFDQLATEGAIC